MKVLSPFGPKIASLKLSRNSIKKINIEVDKIISKKSLLKKLDYSNNSIRDLWHSNEFKNIRKKHLNKQLKESLFENSDWGNLLVAYETIWAIGTGLSASPEQASEVINLIHEIIKEISGGIDIPILYGGSVNEDNATELLNAPNLDGFLIGGASLDSESFYKIYKKFSK